MNKYPHRTKICSFVIPPTLPMNHMTLFNCMKEIFFDLFTILTPEQLEQIWQKKAQCETLYQLFEFDHGQEPIWLKEKREGKQ